MAIIGLSYWFDGNNRQRFLGFNDVANSIVGHPTQGPSPGGFPVQGDVIDPLQPTLSPGDILYSNATKVVKVSSAYPFANVVNKPAACIVELAPPFNETPSDGTDNGSAHVFASGGADEFRLIRINPSLPVFDTGWVPPTAPGNRLFTNLPAGVYQILARDSGNGCEDSNNLVIKLAGNLAANASGVNISVNGASDGEITVQVTNGKGQYEVKYLIDNFTVNLLSGLNPQSTVRSGLAPGIYDIQVTDLTDLMVVNLQVEITEPSVPLPDSNLFFVPKMNSLEFVHEVLTDDCVTFQTLDNTRYCKQYFPSFKKPDYYQKVNKCDSITLQFRSNYSDHLVELLRYVDNVQVATFPILEVEQNVGFESSFNIIIRNNGGGQSRVYFNTGSIPLQLKLDIGDTFFVSNNLDGFDGSYAIQDIKNDTLLNSEYLVINKNYAIAASNSIATGVFYSNLQDYNVYESALDFTLIPDGVYYMRIRAFTGTVEGIPALSEPISIKNEHKDTMLIKYRNFDNAYDITYSTGILNRVRVESRLFNRIPGGNRETLRNGDGRLIKIYARKQRKVLFETFQLPPYLHEKLSVIFDHDFFSISDVEFQTDEGYKDPSYLVRYGLSSSSIVVEQVKWFDTYNTDDIPTGSIEESEFVIANDGLLKQ